MKICIISYEVEPFPGGGIATYHNAAITQLAAAGHEVHVVTNLARHGRTEPQFGERHYRDGNVTYHRLDYFDDRREPRKNVQFLDVCPDRYAGRSRLWAASPWNIAAARASAYVEQLHADVSLDVIECPEFFAEAFYILRARQCGRRAAFPPVCIHGHISSRIAFGTNQHHWEVGYYPHRHQMLREEYCVQHADALLTPSHALMGKYRALFGDALPELQRTISYYLELPECGDSLPAALEGDAPFLACVGRIEPRKGSDLAMRAFARLAPKHPKLRLAFVGKEMWHHGESVDDVIAAHVPESLRDRIIRLGNIPREQALATAQRAAAFLHPAPWDNYPCAVLEAMGVGAACVVSDQGGHSEMVEHERSGLVFPVDDAEALANSIDRMLTDSSFAQACRTGAQARAADITDPAKLTAAKLELYEAMLAREHELAQRSQQPAVAASADATAPRPALPGRGVVVVDCGGSNKWYANATLDSFRDELESSVGWRVIVLTDPGQDLELPAETTRVTTLDAPAWKDLADDEVVIWAIAGVRFDHGMLPGIVHQVHDAPVRCGSFAWLRPASAERFPYRPDFGYHDLLVAGETIPPLFALAARDLRGITSLSGVFRAHHRACVILAAASALGDLPMQHTGEVCGDFYGELPLVDEETQFRAIGFLDLLDVLPRSFTRFGGIGQQKAPIAATQRLSHQPDSAAPEETRQQEAPQLEPPQNNEQPLPDESPSQSGVPSDYAELQKVYAEHMALKQSRVVKALRRLGAFQVARKMFPKSRRSLGSGK